MVILGWNIEKNISFHLNKVSPTRTSAMRRPSFPSPITATLWCGCITFCSTMRNAAARGSARVNQADDTIEMDEMAEKTTNVLHKIKQEKETKSLSCLCCFWWEWMSCTVIVPVNVSYLWTWPVTLRLGPERQTGCRSVTSGTERTFRPSAGSPELYDICNVNHYSNVNHTVT